MSRKLTLPFFPSPPQEYDPQYMSEVVRAFSTYLTQMQNPGEGRNTDLVLTNLQKHDQGLEIGSLFEYRDVSGMMGNIKIATVDKTHILGLEATGSVGSVTVTT
jgi:hypothetical protein|tara:strand:- start:300 stop:611 length:312 start_codon:yes stop_codon:yes gene_type:complete